jgi:hypothetical protein
MGVLAVPMGAGRTGSRLTHRTSPPTIPSRISYAKRVTTDESIVPNKAQSGYAYSNKANSWQVYFAAKSGGAATMRLQFPGVNATETLQGAASAVATTSGSSIEYPGVLPQVDLMYGDRATNVEEELLLHSAQATASYTLDYHVPGATAKLVAHNIVFTDANGNVLLIFGGVTMFETDASGKMLPQGRSSDNVKIALAGTGPDFQITLTPNQ